MTLNKKDWLEIIENAMSWLVVFAMFIYGGAKIIQFEGSTGLDKMVSEMTGMELMWAFYGYSKLFAITLGVFEITGGLLLLFKKTRLIGCLFTSTILVNVILQDIFYGVHVGALKAAILYQLLIVAILWLNRAQLIESIKILIKTSKIDQSKSKLLAKVAIAFILFISFRVIEYYITIKL